MGHYDKQYEATEREDHVAHHNRLRWSFAAVKDALSHLKTPTDNLLITKLEDAAVHIEHTIMRLQKVADAVEKYS